MSKIQKLVVESRIADIEKAFSETEHNSVELQKLKNEFAGLKEEISSGDWGRIGVMAGMLWYKLDALLQHLSTISGSLHNIERNTAKIK